MAAVVQPKIFCVSQSQLWECLNDMFDFYTDVNNVREHVDIGDTTCKPGRQVAVDVTGYVDLLYVSPKPTGVLVAYDPIGAAVNSHVHYNTRYMRTMDSVRAASQKPSTMPRSTSDAEALLNNHGLTPDSYAKPLRAFRDSHGLFTKGARSCQKLHAALVQGLVADSDNSAWTAPVVSVSDMISSFEQAMRNRYPIRGNAIFVYRDEDYQRIGLGDPTEVSKLVDGRWENALPHINF